MLAKRAQVAAAAAFLDNSLRVVSPYVFVLLVLVLNARSAPNREEMKTLSEFAIVDRVGQYLVYKRSER